MEDAVGGGAGWQGGAEDGPGLPREVQQHDKQEQQAEPEVEPRKMPMPGMQYDEDTVEVVEQALELDREEAIRQMHGYE
jgi:hypothetical protein